MPPWLQLHRVQPRTPGGLLDDARLLDLPIQLIEVIDSDATHKGAFLGHKGGEQKDLQLELATAKNQPTLIAIHPLESELPVERDGVIEVETADSAPRDRS